MEDINNQYASLIEAYNVLIAALRDIQDSTQQRIRSLEQEEERLKAALEDLEPKSCYSELITTDSHGNQIRISRRMEKSSARAFADIDRRKGEEVE